MTEIPEHLRKRAEEARKKAAAASAAARRRRAPAGGDAPESEAEPSHDPRPPARALQGGQGQGGRRRRRRPPTVAAARPWPPHRRAARRPPTAARCATGPGGHTQRLLTVVKAGSIQDVRATPLDKVHTWPHLLVVEFVAALACTAFLLVFSIFVNAPLLELANFNETPNPSKAPWYFLGLQELLTCSTRWSPA